MGLSVVEICLVRNSLLALALEKEDALVFPQAYTLKRIFVFLPVKRLK